MRYIKKQRLRSKAIIMNGKAYISHNRFKYTTNWVKLRLKVFTSSSVVLPLDIGHGERPMLSSFLHLLVTSQRKGFESR